MTQVVEFPDLELLLSSYLAAGLSSWSPLVDRHFPPTTWTPGYAVVVRDDSGRDQSMVTASRMISLTCIGADYKVARQMAERAAVLLRALPGHPTIPVADASVRGPYSLDATNRAEFYLTGDLVVVGRSVTL